MPKVSDEHRAARRQQILEAAWRCFSRDGFHAASMESIIAESGLSAGAVYRYFASKDELIICAAEEALGGLSQGIEQLRRLEPPPRPGEFLAGLLSWLDGFALRDRYDLRRIAIHGWGETDRNPQLAELVRRNYGEFRRQIAALSAAWRAHGEIADYADDDAVAETMLSLVMGYVVQSVVMGPIDIARYAAAATAQLQVGSDASEVPE